MKPYSGIALSLLSLSAFLLCEGNAQGSAGASSKLEPRFIIDMPTAGMLGGGGLALDVDMYQSGGVLLGVSVGIFDRVSLGVSYGGTQLIGTGTPEMNAVPGFNVRVRLIEENIGLPAIVIGFDNQGRDGYVKSLSRYVIKSPGFYAVASKNYLLLGYLSLHGGVNYSLERSDSNKDISLFVGFEKTLGPAVSALLEYNLATNDRKENALGKGRGYLNTGLRWSLGSGVTIGATLKDLTMNGRTDSARNRTVTLEYVSSL